MDDDEYWELRDRMTPGEGYHTVLSTILSRPDESATYDEIVDRLERDWQMDGEQTEQVLEELQDERLIRRVAEDAYTVTERTENFLRKDMGDDQFEEYRQALQYGHHITEKTNKIKEGYENVDKPAYDAARMEAAFDIIEPMDIVAYFFGHPQNAPSLPELDYMQPDRDRDEIEHQLTRLENETDILEVLESEEYRKEGLPHRFYRVTDGARAYITNETNYLGTDPAHTEALWTSIYELTEKPDNIKRYEQLPRPDGDTGE